MWDAIKHGDVEERKDRMALTLLFPIKSVTSQIRTRLQNKIDLT